MDAELIYVKTAAGEEAVQQRTRLMQRNVRMILILVDGQSPVGDLCLKTGNPELTEKALRELEKGGFIAPMIEQDSLWAESKKVAQEIRAAAVEKASQIGSLVKKKEHRPSPISQRLKTGSTGATFTDSKFEYSEQSEAPMSRFSLPPVPFGKTETKGQRKAVPSPSPNKSVRKAAQRKTDRPDAPRRSVLERLKAWFPDTSLMVEERVKIRPIRRGERRGQVSWLSIAIRGMAGVVALAAIALFFFPYNLYLPEVEAELTRLTGKPSTVRSIQVTYRPTLAIALGDVVIGNGRGELKASELRVQLALEDLKSLKPAWHEAVLSGPTLTPDTVAQMPTILGNVAKTTTDFRMDQVRLEKATISFAGLSIPGFEGVAALRDGAEGMVSLRSGDGAVELRLVPSGNRLGVEMAALGWRPLPATPAVILESVNARGKIESGVFEATAVDVRAFDGMAKGSVVLDAANDVLSGDLSFERINAGKLSTVFGIGAPVSGELAGKVHFSAPIQSRDNYFSKVEADGDITVHRGSIRGIDLAEAVRRVSAAPVQGGATGFEQLSGRLKISKGYSRLSGVVINSGLVQSMGAIEVARDRNVSGKLELQMRGTANQTRVPVVIGGSLETPYVQAKAH